MTTLPANPTPFAADHRPWPLPRGPWIMAMTWEDLLFAHWPVSPEALRHHLPSGLELDTFHGQAWVGVVPFRMEQTRLRGLPPVPGTGSFPELNVRTYVTSGGKPGVWFFSLDAASRLAVRTARRFFHLPYYDADMRAEARDGWLHYASRRTHRGAVAAEFAGIYRPAGPQFKAAPGSLEHWLTERYCLYAADARQRLFRGEIHHAPWPLQRAEAELRVNRMTPGLGIDRLAGAPHLLFAARLEVVAWRVTPVAPGA